MDGWHAKHHVCDPARFDPCHDDNKEMMDGFNTEGAEQLWSRMDLLAKAVNYMKRPLFRLFFEALLLVEESAHAHVRLARSGE